MTYERKIHRHGLHVLNNIFVDGCRPCEERRQLMTTAALLGIDWKLAVSDANIARTLLCQDKEE